MYELDENSDESNQKKTHAKVNKGFHDNLYREADETGARKYNEGQKQQKRAKAEKTRWAKSRKNMAGQRRHELSVSLCVHIHIHTYI